MKNNISRISLIISNLVPLFGVIFLSWSLPLIMFVYWMENIVIGLINVLKMKKAEGEVLVGETQKLKHFSINGKVVQDISKKFLIPFFLFHYGMFTLVHGIFVVVMFGFPSQSISYILVTFILLFLSHLISYRVNYISKREYIYTSVGKLFSQPYNRVIIMHITIIIGGMFVQSLGSPIYALVVMIVLKIILDLGLHNREHKKFEGKLI